MHRCDISDPQYARVLEGRGGDGPDWSLWSDECLKPLVRKWFYSHYKPQAALLIFQNTHAHTQIILPMLDWKWQHSSSFLMETNTTAVFIFIMLLNRIMAVVMLFVFFIWTCTCRISNNIQMERAIVWNILGCMKNTIALSPETLYFVDKFSTFECLTCSLTTVSANIKGAEHWVCVYDHQFGSVIERLVLSEWIIHFL